MNVASLVVRPSVALASGVVLLIAGIYLASEGGLALARRLRWRVFDRDGAEVAK